MKKNLKPSNILFPMPVLVVSTYNEDGTVDCMAAAWVTMEDNDVVLIELARDHKTTANISRNKAFTLAVADKDNVVSTDYVGGVSQNDDKEKFLKTGWTAKKAEYVDAPIINEMKLSFECELLKIFDDGDEYIVYGKIKNVVVDDSILDERGHIDFTKAGFITYNSADQSYRVVTEKVGCAFRDGLKLK